MTTETFLYNKKSPIQTMLIIAGFMTIMTYDLFVQKKRYGDYNWYIVALDLAGLIYVLYLFTVRLKPAMQRETALELTPGELVFKPKNIVIPWKTISDIATKPANRSGTQQYLDILLNDSAEMKHVRIDLDWIAGNPTDIYTAVVNYLYETRKAAEQQPRG